MESTTNRNSIQVWSPVTSGETHPCTSDRGLGCSQPGAAPVEVTGTVSPDLGLQQQHNYNLRPRITNGCNKNNCKICTKIDNNIYNQYNKKLPTMSFTCHDKNVVYLLTCEQCGMQYVGETERELHKRISEHLYNIRTNKSKNILYNHFNSTCKTIKVKILEKLYDADKNKRIQQENKWIRTLKTKFPYGLNDKIDNSKSEYTTTHNLIKTQNKRSHGKREKE